jgi:hypothetical protein
MRYAYTGEWDALTPILAIAEHRATVMTVGALVSDLNRCEMQAEARELDATPAPALPAAVWTALTRARDYIGLIEPGTPAGVHALEQIDDALAALGAPALPEVDEGRWSNDSGFGFWLDSVGHYSPGCCCIDTDLSAATYRQIAAKALQLAAEAETV